MKEQIKEMVGLLWHFPKTLHLNCYNDCVEAAELLYSEGYRKQSEGEWIEHETAWGDVFYSCSVCGDERCAVDGSIWELGLNYCPNCGAKMKGGAE